MSDKSKKDITKENLLDRKPADMHGGDGVHFSEDQKARKERKENKEKEVDRILKDKKPSK